MDDDGLSVADTDEDSERSDVTMQHEYAMNEREDAIIEMLEAYADYVRDPWTGGWIRCSVRGDG